MGEWEMGEWEMGEWEMEGLYPISYIPSPISLFEWHSI